MHSESFAYYNAERIKEFCKDFIEREKEKKQESIEEAINERIKKNKERKNSTFKKFFYKKNYTRKDALFELKNIEFGFYTLYDDIVRHHIYRINYLEKIMVLCDTCNSDFVVLTKKDANYLKNIGLKTGKKIYGKV